MGAARDRIIRRAGRTRWFAALMARVAPPLDRALYRRFGGRTLGAGPPTLLLTTIGRRSGRQRTVPLLYVRNRERLVVAASNWGRECHPEWSENLLADPRAWVRVGDEASERRARLAGTQEKERLWWPLLVKMWPAYVAYEVRSGRDTRVFVLEPW